MIKNSAKLIFEIFALLILASAVPGQNKVEVDEAKAKGGIILNDARNANGVEKLNLSSISLKSKFLTENSFNEKMNEQKTEISVLLPDKIRTVSIIEQLGGFTTTRIWNGEKYKAVSETELLGRRFVKDVTNSSLTEGKVEQAVGKINKEESGSLDTFQKYNPREAVHASLWQILYPVLLTHPFEENLEYRYVGKFKSANRVANVIDVKSKFGRDYRLLFDSETNFLLMMIESFKSKNGAAENKYYYSNRETINKISVPKTIKIEEKFTPTGKEPRTIYSQIEILEFDINPKLDGKKFEIK